MSTPSPVRHETVDGIAVVTLDHPPVNAFSAAQRRGVVEAIDAANADAAVRAIVLIGSESVFSGGADIREFNRPEALAEPNLHSLIEVVEQSTKPVVAAIGGFALGGGLELALACHWRVAKADAQLGLPEVKIGLLPGAGGTQRLPRAIGLEAAANMIVSGEPQPARRFTGSALVHQLIDGELRAGAIAFARAHADQPATLLRTVRVIHPDAEAFLQFTRNTVKAMSGPYPAPLACLEAVAASLKPTFADGLRAETEGFRKLILGAESRALRHAFFGERATSKIPDVPESTPVRAIARVAVIGAGTMGGGIAMNFLNAGLPVTILETKQDALDRGLATIRGNYVAQVKKGKLAQEKLDARMALLTPTLDYAGIADADLVIEAVFEEIGVKQAVFERLDAVCKPGAILASNTSTLDLDRIAGFTKRPADVIGLHFFSPANVMRLLEVVRGKATAADVLMTALKLAKTIRKLPVVSGVCDGFIGNRMVNVYAREALALVDEGASPAQVDGALERFGMAMGPLRMGDLAGNDIGWAIRKRHYAEHPEAPRARIIDALCEQGRYGQKTGSGWYRYLPGNRVPQHDPEVDAIIDAGRRELGLVPRRIDDEEIVERCLYALVNEGARILEEGIALRASDIDMVYLNGYGFPRHRGGPMLHADQTGLWRVARRMRAFAVAATHPQLAAFWQPAALIERHLAAGRGLTD